MDVATISVVAVTGAVILGLLGLLLIRRFGRKRYKLTKPELRNRALRESQSLIDLINKRQANRPANDSVIKDHELPHRRVTLYDEGTQRIYAGDHLRAVAELRQGFAERGIRNGMLDDLYEHPENEADLRTISTALAEMAGRLR